MNNISVEQFVTFVNKSGFYFCTEGELAEISVHKISDNYILRLYGGDSFCCSNDFALNDADITEIDGRIRIETKEGICILINVYQRLTKLDFSIVI